MSNDETPPNTDNTFTVELENELDYIVSEMYSYRNRENLPEPSDDEIQNLIESYINLKEGAMLYAMIGDGAAILNVENDNIAAIVHEHSCPECDNSNDDEVEHHRSIN